MKTEKKIIIIIFLLFYFWQVYADKETLKVFNTPKSGSYNSTLNVKLGSNNPNAKIFYTLDPEWRMDKQLEYKKPIKLKETNTIYYFAFTDYSNATLIKEASYEIVYPNNLKVIRNKEWTFIKNTKETEINLDNRIIKTNNIQIKFGHAPLQAKKEYKIDKINKDSEIELISPDKKIKKVFNFK